MTIKSVLPDVTTVDPSPHPPAPYGLNTQTQLLLPKWSGKQFTRSIPSVMLKCNGGISGDQWRPGQFVAITQ